MANSWNGPQLGSPIRTDVPELQKKLIALLKGDPTSVANIPSGAKRLVNTSGTKWQVQQYNGSSWAAIGKLMHDVDKLDGYHAAITPAASTVAVRNADKKLEGDITGNAATASSATTLSETLPVNKGGTGATTSEAARANLGVPPTSHASSGTTYGLGTDTNYGHVRSDSKTTKINSGQVVVKDVAIGGDSTDLATLRGQIGNILEASTITDFNDVTNSGVYFLTNSMTSAAANKPPTNRGGHLVVYSYQDGRYIRQIYFCYNGSLIYSRYYTETTWGEWGLVITSRGGIMDENSNLIVHARTQTNNNPVYAGFAIRGTDVDGTTRDLYPFAYVPGNNYGTGLVINVNGLLILGGGESPLVVAKSLVQDEALTGESERLYLTSDGPIYLLHGQNTGYDALKSVIINGNTGKLQIGGTDPDIILRNIGIQKGEVPSENQFTALAFSDKNGTSNADYFGMVETGVRTDGSVDLKLAIFPNEVGQDFKSMGLKMNADKTSYAYCPTPAANSNNNHIATTEWVRSYTLPTGALIPSLATSMTGYLLCNGAAVSRTTYANLFSIIGTKFGAGDGSTTFNLPDFRNRVFWGASGNLMSVIEAGLPDHSHSINVPDSSRDCGYASGSPRFWQDFHSDSTGSASASNAIYGKSTTVQPPAIAVNIFIKY